MRPSFNGSSRTRWCTFAHTAELSNGFPSAIKPWRVVFTADAKFWLNDEELNTEELNIGTEVTGPYNLKSCQGEDYKFHFL